MPVSGAGPPPGGGPTQGIVVDRERRGRDLRGVCSRGAVAGATAVAGSQRVVSGLSGRPP